MFKHILPTPVEYNATGAAAEIARVSQAGFTFIADEKSAVAKEYIERALKSAAAVNPPYDGNYKITLKIDETDSRIAGKGSEAYAISVSEREAIIVGASEVGVFYAAITLTKMIDISGERVLLPISELVDYPKFETRGMYFECRFNDFMTLDDWKCAVDDFAALKINKMVIGLYGCWPMQYDKQLSQFMHLNLDCAPKIKVARTKKYYSVKQEKWINEEPEYSTMYKENYFAELVEYGKKNHVEVVPLFNSLGHNSLLPEVYPEISAKDEGGNPTGYGMCLSDDKTIKFMTEIYDEIIDKYVFPFGNDSFALGMDEVWPLEGIDKNDLKKKFSPHCRCEKCRGTEPSEMMIQYTIKLLKHLKNRGIKNGYIYHDMFFYEYDILNADLAQRFKDEGVYDIAVMDWWSYSNLEKEVYRGRFADVNGAFRSTAKPMAGYENWRYYTDYTRNVKYLCALAEKHGFEGMIGYTTYEPMLDYNYRYFAECVWNGSDDKYFESYIDKYFENFYGRRAETAKKLYEDYIATVLPHEDDKASGILPWLNQYTYAQIIEEQDYPRDHIAELRDKLDANKELYLPYLDKCVEVSDAALAFFTSSKANSSANNDNIVTNIKTHRVLANEARMLYKMQDASAAGNMTAAEALDIIEELISDRRDLMLSLENVRRKSTLPTPLRIMTIALEYLLEAKAAVEKQISENAEFKFEMKSVADSNAPVFEFIR